MKVTLFKTLENEAKSMEIYSDNITKGVSKDIEIKHYRPEMLHFKFGRLITRFFIYPFKARKQQGDINHIIDQTYGHLTMMLNKKKTIVTCHDVIPLQDKKTSGNLLFRMLFKFSISKIRKAARIITISEVVKKDILSFIKYDPDKIKVIHSFSCEDFSRFSDTEKKKLRVKYGLDKYKIVLHVGDYVAYKNFSTVLKTMAELVKEDKNIKLVKVGSLSDEEERLVDTLKLKKHMVHVQDISFKELINYYNIADCLVFVSYIGGWANPPLEAMCCGCPVVISKDSSYEFIKEDGLLVEAFNIVKIKEAILIILKDKKLRNKLIGDGYKKARTLNKEKLAGEHEELYKEVYNEL